MAKYAEILATLNSDMRDGRSEKEAVRRAISAIKSKRPIPESLSGVVDKIDTEGYSTGDSDNLKSGLQEAADQEVHQGGPGAPGGYRRRGKKTRKGRRMSRRWRGGLDTPTSFPKPLPKDPLDAAIVLTTKFRDAVQPSRFSGTPVELKIIGTQGEKDAIDRLIEVLRKEKESQQSTVTARAASALKGLFAPKKGGAVTEMLMEKLAELKTTKKVTIDTDLQSVFEKLNNAVSILEQQKEDESGASVDVGKPGLGSLGITAASSFGGKPKKSRRYTRRR